jgi:hypothetical protein
VDLITVGTHQCESQRRSRWRGILILIRHAGPVARRTYSAVIPVGSIVTARAVRALTNPERDEHFAQRRHHPCPDHRRSGRSGGRSPTGSECAMVRSSRQPVPELSRVRSAFIFVREVPGVRLSDAMRTDGAMQVIEESASADTTAARCVGTRLRLGTLSGRPRRPDRPVSRGRRHLMLDVTLIVLSACAVPTELNRTALTGEWVGVTGGVRVELQIVESTPHEPGDYETLDGTGSLTVVSTGETIQFTATGSRNNPPNGVEIGFFGDGPGLTVKDYGVFRGDLNLAGALIGATSTIPNMGAPRDSVLTNNQISLTRK